MPRPGRAVPAHFDLTIGGSSMPRACRIARQHPEGFGVEFLDPVRHEIERILEEFAFHDDLVFEALSPDLDPEATATRVRLRQTAVALLGLIERRSTIAWQSGEVIAHRPTGAVARLEGPARRPVPSDWQEAFLA